MPREGISKLKNDLESLSGRIEQRRQDLVRNGEFSDEHAVLVRSINDRQARLKARVDDAIARGNTLEIIGTELARDFDALMEQFRVWLEKIDGDMAKDVAKRSLGDHD